MTLVRMIANADEATLLAKLGIYMQGRDDGKFTLDYDDALGFTRVEAPAPVECQNCAEIERGLQETSTGKIRVDLVPAELEFVVAWTMTEGAKHYDPRAWEKGRRWGNEYAAIKRHLGAWWGGETVDPEFGRSHLWNALTRLTMLVAMEMRAIGADDRPWSAMSGLPQPTTATGPNPDYAPAPEPEIDEAELAEAMLAHDVSGGKVQATPTPYETLANAGVDRHREAALQAQAIRAANGARNFGND